MITQRQEGFGSLLIDGKYSIITGSELAQFKENTLGHLKPSPDSPITGTVACPGQATGTVQIVRSVEDIPTFKSGGVMVAVMTFPSYMPAMERAAALVTDDGGILSHAAIIARELRKPCVIDTSIATQVLADGDVVEVTAKGEIGTVRKVARPV